MAIWNILWYLVYFVVIWYIYGHLEYFVAIWYILWSFGIFFPVLVYFVAIWYISSRFGILYQGKFGNPAVGVATASLQTVGVKQCPFFPLPT
jgi:hypothetical protein